MKNIKITLEWSKEHALQASKAFYDYDMRHSNKRYMGWFFVALTQFAIVGALKHDTYGLLFVSTFLMAYWYYGRWLVRKAMVKKYYANIKESTLHFTLKEDGLYNEAQLISWDQIFKVIKVEDDVLLHTYDSTLLFKRNSFSSYDDLQLFLDTMREKGKM
jgi:hypothetical protein